MDYKRNEKNLLKRATAVLIEIIKQHLALFSAVIQQRGAFIRGSLKPDVFFCCFQLDGPLTRGGGGISGGAYNRNCMVSNTMYK